MPFEVPAGWVWVRLDSIGDIVTGSTPPKDNKEFYGGHVSFYKPTDLEQGINTITSTDSLTEEGFAVARQLPIYSILVTCIGATIGKTGMIRKAGTCNQQINAIIPLPSVYPGYIYYVCISDFMQFCIKNNASATTLPILNKNHFAELQIPLAPLEEQKRIVTAIEKWCTLIDSLETAKEDMQTSIAQAKCKILDLAIHGKLVPQDPNDEPAIELLKRSNPAFVPCDNAHYGNLPASWCWTTLGSLFQHNTGKALNRSDVQDGRPRPYLTTSNVYWNCFDFTDVKEMYFKDSELEKCTIAKGDLLVCEGGDIGRAAIWNLDYNICIQNHIHRLRAKADVCPTLYLYVLMLYKWKGKIQGKGIGLQGLSSGLLDKLIVPLPPYNEQIRIVAKTEELLAVLDEIAAAAM